MGSNEGNFLQGGSADDTIYVINTADRISGGGGIDTAYATVDFSLPSDVENLTMDARWSPVTGVGNAGNNILTAVNAGVTLQGGGGDDVFVSAGGDTFVFMPGSGDSTLFNFHPDSDTIRLGSYGLNTFAQVQAAMTQVGADTLLKLSSSDLILFKNTLVSAFTSSDFQLSIDPQALQSTFTENFDALKLQQQGHADGWNAAYSWDVYNSQSAHTITGESEIYVDPTFAGSGSSPLGLNPFSISGGVLSIHAAQTPAADLSALWNHNYTSGVLTTAGSFAQTYGYFEMRAELPSGQGSFPAFWLLSQDGKYNEIDIMETVNGGDQVWNHIHYTAAGDTAQTSVGFSTTVPDLTDSFHTFGLLWTPQTLTWYVDDAAVASTPTPAALNSPMYMLADYAVGGSWAGAPDGSPLSAMQIDYIKAYSLDSAPVTPPPTTTVTDPPVSVPPDPGAGAGSGSIPDAGSTTPTTNTVPTAPSSTAPGHLIGTATDGTAGNDALVGDGAGDSLRGMGGNDTITGGAGADLINGNTGDDLIHGGAGDDTLYGGQGTDTIYGDTGQKLINGNLGGDLIYGGSGENTLYGGQGDDTVHGGPSADVISGDRGNDILYGGGGADQFLFGPGGGQDWIGDFSASSGDKIVLPSGTAYTIETYDNQVVIDLGHGDELGLAGVSADQLPAQVSDWLVYS